MRIWKLVQHLVHRFLLKLFVRLVSKETNIMLTKRDLRWTTKFFSIYSKLMIIPFTFTPVMLGGGGGQIESGPISCWRKIGFKMTQILVVCQTVFISVRTLEYMKYGDAGFFGEEPTEDLDLNWDFVPMLLSTSLYFLALNAIASLVFDVSRELNRKVFNELIRLRGKADGRKTHKNHYIVKIIIN